MPANPARAFLISYDDIGAHSAPPPERAGDGVHIATECTSRAAFLSHVAASEGGPTENAPVELEFPRAKTKP